ncbi:helix-hairpin-helix domain-containing protein [Dyadobacter sp. 22481]
MIEGIGPKIEEFLYNDGIDTYADLAAANLSKLLNLLNRAGEGYQMHDPTSWPLQSRLARDGKWEELKKLQAQLIAGRRTT